MDEHVLKRKADLLAMSVIEGNLSKAKILAGALHDALETDKMHEDVVRMWPAVMAGEPPTLEEFNEQPYVERWRFRNWLARQYSDVMTPLD